MNEHQKNIKEIVDNLIEHAEAKGYYAARGEGFYKDMHHAKMVYFERELLQAISDSRLYSQELKIDELHGFDLIFKIQSLVNHVLALGRMETTLVLRPDFLEAKNYVNQLNPKIAELSQLIDQIIRNSSYSYRLPMDRSRVCREFRRG